MTKHDRKCTGCSEYNELSRRGFVGLSAGFAAALAAPSWLPRVVYADSHNGSRDVIVSVFLRGGVDGLTLCVPFLEDAYYELRPTQAVPPPDSGEPTRALDLDGEFGLPPAMRPLRKAFKNNDLLFVQACGLERTNRSHFDAMHFMEVGQGYPPASRFTGWLGRHLASTAPTLRGGVLRGVGIGFGLQRTLVGAPKTLPINDLADFGLSGSGKTVKERRKILQELYAEASAPLKESGSNTFRTISTLGKIPFSNYRPKGGARYPDDEFGYALQSTAALIRAEVGVEAVAIDLDGWDTHDFQGTHDGHMMYLMQSLAEGLAAFHTDLWSAGFGKRVVVVAMSEFGRNVFENASEGTDHGYGGVMMAMGGGIKGGPRDDQVARAQQGPAPRGAGSQDHHRLPRRADRDSEPPARQLGLSGGVPGPQVPAQEPGRDAVGRIV